MKNQNHRPEKINYINKNIHLCVNMLDYFSSVSKLTTCLLRQPMIVFYTILIDFKNIEVANLIYFQNNEVAKLFFFTNIVVAKLFFFKNIVVIQNYSSYKILKLQN